jgi:hypothetical protein
MELQEKYIKIVMYGGINKLNIQLKGTVQRNLKWVLSNINQFDSLWAVVASPWFFQKYGRHFEFHEKRFSTI